MSKNNHNRSMMMHREEQSVDAAPILSVTGLSFGYKKLSVLKDVNLSLDQSTISLLLGANGSGKSTLLRCLAGWAPIKQGSISLCGKAFDPADRALRKLLYFVPDTPPFYDDLTASEHIRFVLGVNDLLDRCDYSENLLDRFGLYDVKDQYPSSYSRGMRVKLALVIALTLRPKLLLLDEPYGPLDNDASFLLSRELAVLASEGTAIMLSLHQEVPELVADQILKLDKGHIYRESSDQGNPLIIPDSQEEDES